MVERLNVSTRVTQACMSVALTVKVRARFELAYIVHT